MSNVSNRENYPELAVCGAMPEIIEGITNIEIADWNSIKLCLDVPTLVVTKLHMPKLRPEYSGNHDSPFEKSIGLGLVACRIINAHEDLYCIEIPTIADPATLVIPFTGIARQRPKRA
jgi:hypothetical protein